MSTEDLRSDADPFDVALDVGSRDGFAVEVQHPAQGVVLLSVEGELDLWTSLPLLDAILAAFHEHPAAIALDMSHARSMDSTGLRMLMEASSHVEEGGVHCAVICRAGSEVARLLAQTDVSHALNVNESLGDALSPWLGEAGGLPAGI